MSMLRIGLDDPEIRRAPNASFRNGLVRRIGRLRVVGGLTEWSAQW
jgi:hypothetical protein